MGSGLLAQASSRTRIGSQPLGTGPHGHPCKSGGPCACGGTCRGAGSAAGNAAKLSALNASKPEKRSPCKTMVSRASSGIAARGTTDSSSFAPVDRQRQASPPNGSRGVVAASSVNHEVEKGLIARRMPGWRLRRAQWAERSAGLGPILLSEGSGSTSASFAHASQGFSFGPFGFFNLPPGTLPDAGNFSSVFLNPFPAGDFCNCGPNQCGPGKTQINKLPCSCGCREGFCHNGKCCPAQQFLESCTPGCGCAGAKGCKNGLCRCRGAGFCDDDCPCPNPQVCGPNGTCSCPPFACDGKCKIDCPFKKKCVNNECVPDVPEPSCGGCWTKNQMSAPWKKIPNTDFKTCQKWQDDADAVKANYPQWLQTQFVFDCEHLS